MARRSASGVEKYTATNKAVITGLKGLMQDVASYSLEVVTPCPWVDTKLTYNLRVSGCRVGGRS